MVDSLRSAVDIAVYFGGSSESVPGRRTTIDIKEQVEFDAEEPFWSDLERALGREVELLVLNRAPVTVCATAAVTPAGSTWSGSGR